MKGCWKSMLLAALMLLSPVAASSHGFQPPNGIGPSDESVDGGNNPIAWPGFIDVEFDSTDLSISDSSGDVEELVNHLRYGGFINLSLPNLNQTHLVEVVESPSSRECNRVDSSALVEMYILRTDDGYLTGSITYIDRPTIPFFEMYLAGANISSQSTSAPKGFQIHYHNDFLTQPSTYQLDSLGYTMIPYGNQSIHFGDNMPKLFQNHTLSLHISQYQFRAYRLSLYYDNENPLLICKELNRADSISRARIGVALVLVSLTKYSPQSNQFVYPSGLDCSLELGVLERNSHNLSNGIINSLGQSYRDNHDILGLIYHSSDFSGSINKSSSFVGCASVYTNLPYHLPRVFWAEHAFNPSSVIRPTDIDGWHVQVLLHEIFHSMGAEHDKSIQGGLHSELNNSTCPDLGLRIEGENQFIRPYRLDHFSSLMLWDRTHYYCWGHVPFITLNNTNSLQLDQLPFSLYEPNMLDFLVSLHPNQNARLLGTSLIYPHINHHHNHQLDQGETIYSGFGEFIFQSIGNVTIGMESNVISNVSNQSGFTTVQFGFIIINSQVNANVSNINSQPTFSPIINRTFFTGWAALNQVSHHSYQSNPFVYFGQNASCNPNCGNYVLDAPSNGITLVRPFLTYTSYSGGTLYGPEIFIVH